jgi:adrenodoxin-NADP+ reductase
MSKSSLLPVLHTCADTFNQAAFTIKEVRELINLPGVIFSPISRELFPDDLKSLPRPRRRLAELLVKERNAEGSNATQNKVFDLDFLLSPIAFNESSPNSGQLGSIDFKPNRYVEQIALSDPRAAVEACTSFKPIQFQASAAFRSIGYKAEPLSGMSSVNVPFDNQRGFILNQLGRVISPATQGIDVTPPVPGMYVAGWAKRGPTGVIASTMEDAFGTADSIIHDIGVKVPVLNHEEGGSTGLGWEGVRKDVEQQGLRTTSWADWMRIDSLEREKGKDLGKEREKMTNVDEMLRALDG